jgi:Mn2+/Fe2+ NRAMP family transporter
MPDTRPPFHGARVSLRELFGPGLVFALTVIGPSDIISNATAGSTYGVSLLWALVAALVFRYVWVATSAKYVLVTGESLIQGYARLGRWAVWLLLVSLLIYRHAGNLYLVLVIGVSADLLIHLPTAYSSAVWSLAFVGMAFGIMYWGKYRAVETLFKGTAAVLGLAFGAAALLARPDLPAVARAILVPRLPANAGFYSVLFVLMALIGAGSGSLTNLTYSYFVHAKGWRSPAFLTRQRFDLLLSVIGVFALSACVQIAAAGTLRSGAAPGDLDGMARILGQAVGRVGVFIFGAGLWAASLSVFIGASTGFALIGTDICRNILAPPGMGAPGSAGGRSLEEGGVYRAFVLFAVISPLYILLTGARPVWLVLFVTALTLAMVPLTAVGLIVITNDRTRMGRYANGWVINILLALLTVTAVALAVMNILGVSR